MKMSNVKFSLEIIDRKTRRGNQRKFLSFEPTKPKRNRLPHPWLSGEVFDLRTSLQCLKDEIVSTIKKEANLTQCALIFSYF